MTWPDETRPPDLLDLNALLAQDEVIRPRGPLVTSLVAFVSGLSPLAKVFLGLALSTVASRLFERPAVEVAAAPQTYSFRPRQNTVGVGLAVPVVYGQHRVFPPIIQQYIDTDTTDKEILYTLYALSEGEIESVRAVELNEQPMSFYANASAIVRTGTPTQDAIPWFQDTRNTYGVDVELLDDGRVFIYRTVTRVDQFIVKMRVPAGGTGLRGISSASTTVTVRVEHKLEAEDAYTSLGDFALTGDTSKPVTRKIDSGSLVPAQVRQTGTAANDAAQAGTAWTSPTNAQGLADDQWAEVAEPTATPRQTQYLKATGFGFALPTDAVILGIQVEVERHHAPGGVSPGSNWTPEAGLTEGTPLDPNPGFELQSTFDTHAQLVLAGTVQGVNKADTVTAWPTTDTVKVYGGPTDTWGRTWTPAEINASGFGFALAALVDLGNCRVDAMKIKVFYSSLSTLLAQRRHIRVTRVSTSTTDKPPLLFASVDEILYGTTANTYPDIATLGIKVQASEQLSGSPPNVSAFVKGVKVRPLTGGVLGTTRAWSDNNVECMIDFMTSVRYGYGAWIKDADLALSGFQTVKDYCDEFTSGEQRHRLDLVVDEQQPWPRWRDTFLNTFRGIMVEGDGRYRLAVDHLASVSQIFDDANMIRGSLRTSWPSLSEKQDQVEGVFLDRDDNFRRASVVLPLTGEKRKTVDLRGITRPSEARREVTYHQNVLAKIAQGIEYGCALEALSVDVADVVGVSHSLPRAGDPASPWGLGAGRIMAVTTADAGTNHLITIDSGDMPTSPSGLSLLIRQANDTIEQRAVLTISARYLSAEGYPRQDVKVSGLFAVTPTVRDAHWALGPTVQVTKPFRLMALTLNDDYTRRVVALEYDASVYEVGTQPGADVHVMSYSGNGALRTLPLPWKADLAVIRRRDASVAAPAVVRCSNWGVADTTSSGPRDPTSGADDAAVGTLAWTSPGNILASDDARATATVGGGASVSTHYARGTGFGFSIPAGATIEGILLEVERSATDAQVVDSTIRLRKSTGFVGDNKAAGGDWPGTDTYRSYGGATDLWGTTWTAAEINDAGFGAGVSALVFPSAVARVDHMRVTVYYTPGRTQLLEGSIGQGDMILSLPLLGVALGTDAAVNANGATYDLVAMRAGSRVTVGTYTGDGVAGGKTVALPFTPKMVWAFGDGVSGSVRDARMRTDKHATTESYVMKNTGGGVSATLGIHGTGAASFLAKGTGTSVNDFNESGKVYFYVAFGNAFNFDLVEYAGDGADNRLVPVAVDVVDFAFLLTAQTADFDNGATLRVSGYNTTDLSGQVRSAVSKADFIQRLLTSQVEVGTKGNVVNASTKQQLFVAKMFTTP